MGNLQKKLGLVSKCVPARISGYQISSQPETNFKMLYKFLNLTCFLFKLQPQPQNWQIEKIYESNPVFALSMTENTIDWYYRYEHLKSKLKGSPQRIKLNNNDNIEISQIHFLYERIKRSMSRICKYSVRNQNINLFEMKSNKDQKYLIRKLIINS